MAPPSRFIGAPQQIVIMKLVMGHEAAPGRRHVLVQEYLSVGPREAHATSNVIYKCIRIYWEEVTCACERFVRGLQHARVASASNRGSHKHGKTVTE
jgi:hypothetical protein